MIGLNIARNGEIVYILAQGHFELWKMSSYCSEQSNLPLSPTVKDLGLILWLIIGIDEDAHVINPEPHQRNETMTKFTIWPRLRIKKPNFTKIEDLANLRKSRSLASSHFDRIKRSFGISTTSYIIIPPRPSSTSSWCDSTAPDTRFVWGDINNKTSKSLWSIAKLTQASLWQETLYRQKIISHDYKVIGNLLLTKYTDKCRKLAYKYIM